LISNQLINGESKEGGQSEGKDSFAEVTSQVCCTINLTSSLPSSNNFLPSPEAWLLDLLGEHQRLKP